MILSAIALPPVPSCLAPTEKPCTRVVGGDASVMEEVQKRNQKLANIAASTAASTRNFYASAGKSIKAKKISSFA